MHERIKQNEFKTKNSYILLKRLLVLLKALDQDSLNPCHAE